MLKFTDMGRLSSRFLQSSCTNINKDFKSPHYPICLTQQVPLRKLGGSDAGQCQNCGDINDSIWAAVRNSKKLYFPTQHAPPDYTAREAKKIATVNPSKLGKALKCFPDTEVEHPDVKITQDIHMKRQLKKYKRVSPEFLKLLEPYEKYSDPPQTTSKQSSIGRVMLTPREDEEDLEDDDDEEEWMHWKGQDKGSDKERESWKNMRGYFGKMIAYKTFRPEPRNKDDLEEQLSDEVIPFGPAFRSFSDGKRTRTVNEHKDRPPGIQLRIRMSDDIIEDSEKRRRSRGEDPFHPRFRSTEPGEAKKIKVKDVSHPNLRVGTWNIKDDFKSSGEKQREMKPHAAEVYTPNRKVDHDPVQKRTFMTSKSKHITDDKEKSYPKPRGKKKRESMRLSPNEGQDPDYILGVNEDKNKLRNPKS